jgi:hypothetical protein
VGGSVRLSLEAPGWNSVSEVGDPGFAVVRGITGPPNGMSVYFYEVDNTYTDACAHKLRNPVVGPTVEDLVQALGELPNTTATEPVDATLAGYPARYLVLTSDDSLPCAPSEFYFWQDPGGGQNWAQSPGQVVRTWVFEVDGTRIVASALSYPTASVAALAEQQSILDSIQFE